MLLLLFVDRVPARLHLVDVFIGVREDQHASGGLFIPEGELVEPLHLLADILVRCPVVALRPEPVAVPVFDPFRDPLPLHADQVQHRLQRLVVLPEQLVPVLEPRHDSRLAQAFRPAFVVSQDKPDPRLVLIFHQFPAFRHDVDDAVRRSVIVPGFDQEHVISYAQYRCRLIQELAPFLEGVWPYLQPVLQLLLRASPDVRLQLRRVAPPGVQACPDQLAFIDRSAPRCPDRRISFQHFEDLRVLQCCRLLFPAENLLKHSHLSSPSCFRSSAGSPASPS